MTNVIKAPIRRIRRKGPVIFDEVKDILRKRALFPKDEYNQWAIVNGFIEWGILNILDSSKEDDYKYAYGVMFVNHVDGELKVFSLRKLMPELECW